MRRSAIIVLFFLSVFFTARADEYHNIEFSVNSGIAFPISPMTFSQYWMMQYGGSLRAGIPLSSTVTVFGAVEYYRFTMDKNGVDKNYNPQYLRDIWIFNDVTMTANADPSAITTYSLNSRISPTVHSGIVAPYFLVGVGIMHVSLSQIDFRTKSNFSLDSSEVSITAKQRVTGGEGTSLFVQLGCGLETRLRENLDLYIEARYAGGMKNVWGTAYIPLTAGLKIKL